MEGYKVVNYDWNQALPTIYTTFKEALDAQKSWDEYAIVEYFDSDADYVETVYSREYEDISRECLASLNKSVNKLRLVSK
jgi:hypothetical protein